MIVINNTKGKPLFRIEDNGLLYKADCDGHFRDAQPVSHKAVTACGFWMEYNRPNLAGGDTALYRRNDGTTLRRHVNQGGQVWWDTGETLTTPKDIDAVRKREAPPSLFGGDGKGDKPAKAKARWM